LTPLREPSRGFARLDYKTEEKVDARRSYSFSQQHFVIQIFLMQEYRQVD